MASVLKKLPLPDFSGQSSHQYHQVPLDAESDSEDDEALLYAAPALNHQQDRNSKHDVSFGVGLYDHSRDLDLPRIVQLPKKGSKKKRLGGGANGAGRRLLRSKVFACVFVILSCLLVALIAAFAVLVAGNWDYFSPTSNSSLTSECTPVPGPLSSSEQKPCPTTDHHIETQPIPSTKSEPSAPSTEPSGEENPGEDKDGSISIDTVSPKQDAITTATSSAPTLAISTENKPAPATTSFEDFTTEYGISTDQSTTSEGTTGPPTPPPNDAAKSSVSTEPPIASEGTTGTPPNNAREPLTTATTKSGPSFNVEIITEEKEEPTTSCTPVPTPLTQSSVPPLLVPTPVLDVGQQPDLSGGHNVVVTVQTERMDIAATDMPLDVQTSTQATSKSSEGKHEGDSILQNFESPFEQGTPLSSGSHLYWERHFFPAMSEASPRAVDLNHDGTDERLVITDVGISDVFIYVLDGRNGSIVWNQTVNFPVFGLRCFEDINDDGNLDCFISGRGGGFGALSGRDGSFLWFVDKTIIYPRYNFYFPLRVPDMNGDGVADLVNTHGGDTVYQPEDHDRSPGFLVVVSGKTGQKLMDPMLMPDGRETYMSPVLYGSGSDGVILFGSGGETVPGSLWGVTLGSLQEKISAYEKDKYIVRVDNTIHPWNMSPFSSPRPKMDYTKFDVNSTSGRLAHGNCPTWGGKQVPIWNYYDLCLYEFVRSETKGMILPPVVVDVTVDGVDDLVVSTFDGHTIVLDGRDFKRRIWDAFFPGTESYSVPAPLFYTSDNIPDFLIRSSLGEWATGYVRSSLFVLDGSNGAVVWSFNTSNMGMMSTISFMSQTHGRDAMIFYTVDADYEAMAFGGGDHNETEAQPPGDGGESEARANPSPPSGRRRRHNQQQGQQLGGKDDFQPPPMGEAGEEYGGEEDDPEMPEDSIDYNDDRIKQSMTHRDPPELWQSNGVNDKLPDPLTERAYLRYCGVTAGSLYLVNREMVESGVEITPMARYRPFIYFAPGSSPIVPEHLISKRHMGGMSHHPSPPKGGTGSQNEGEGSPDHLSDLMQETLQASRCGHVLYPNGIGTPLIADLNGDGRQDITYDIAWSASNMAAPPFMKIVGADLEEMFEAAYGKGILDFSSFVAPGEQPWSQYMGKDADNKFISPHSEKS